MKKIITISAILFFALNLNAEEVTIKGDWEKIRPRSLIVGQDDSPPVVYINNRILSIYLEDVISNLCVKITDSRGNVVYQDYITTNRPKYTYLLMLNNLPKGNYSIMLLHEYGSLAGYFEI